MNPVFCTGEIKPLLGQWLIILFLGNCFSSENVKLFFHRSGFSHRWKTQTAPEEHQTESIKSFLGPLFGSLSSPRPVGFLERTRRKPYKTNRNQHFLWFGGPFPGQRRLSPRQDPGLRSWLRPSGFSPPLWFFSPGKKPNGSRGAPDWIN